MRDRDILDPNRGTGRLSRQADREIRELDDPNHPRTQLSPFVELEISDEQVALAGEDEMRTHFDPDVHPRAHRASDPDEPVCDSNGDLCDIMRDTPSIDDLTTGPDPAKKQGDMVLDTDPIEDVLDIK